MQFWKMLSSNRVSLLLLVWCFNKVSASLEPLDESFDQIATASYFRPRNATDNNSTLERPLIRDIDVTTIRYENSNGFVPITPEARTATRDLEEASYAENTSDGNLNSEKHLSLFIRKPENSDDIDKSVDSDPFYSSEARMFLSLTQPRSGNRRSFNSRDSTDDLELLRINDNTPSVASYQHFYNSLTSGSGQNSQGRNNEADNSQPKLYEDRMNHNGGEIDPNNAPHGDKSRDNYAFNYPANSQPQDQRNAATASTSQFFSYTQLNDDRNDRNNRGISKTRNSDYNSQMKGKNLDNYRQNYNQRDYHRYDQENSQKMIPSSDLTFRQKHPQRNNNNLQPKEYAPMRIGAKPSSKQNSNLENLRSRNENFRPSPRQEETVSYFAHEALFNRDEDSGQNFDKKEKEETREDLSDENYEYVEITEKPKRYRKQRKRPSSQSSEDSGRLPKEHREFEEEESSAGKRKIRFRQKPRSHKFRANAWLENEDESGEENIDAASQSAVYSENRKQKLSGSQNRRPKNNGWNNVSPNVEISHSSGIEIDQVGKPKLVLPVKVNLVPLANFDHETALGNSQGFDISNAVLQNFATAAPIGFPNISPVAPISNTPQNIFGQNVVKTLQNFPSQNLKVQNSLPEVIVGQNPAFQNPIQTILVPQQNYQAQVKLGQNLRNVFSTNGQNSYSQNPNGRSPNLNLLQQPNSPAQNVLGNFPIVQSPVSIDNQNAMQNIQNLNGNRVQNQVQSNGQVDSPHPTPQTFENYAQQTSNYNVQVNPRGLQGHSLPLNQNLYNPQGAVTFSTTPTLNYLQSGNLADGTESHGKKNFVSGSNGQFLASASFTVGEQIQNQINPQNLRPQAQDNFQQSFRHDNLYPKMKTFNQITEANPTTSNLNSQSGLSAQQFARDHQTEQFAQASNAVAQTYKDQNQQILKVANEIFESTLERLKQLQKNQNFRPDRSESQNLLSQEIASLGRTNEPQVENSGLKNAEIVTQNAFNNPYETSNSFAALTLTTPFPIFATTGFDPSLRTPTLSNIGQTSSMNSYANSPTGIGAREKDLKTSPTTKLKANSPELRFSPVLFNPINFVPNLDTLKNQNALNNKYSTRESSLQGLNLVPLIPGGNFYRNSYSAQDDLFSKPKLSSDLQNYAQEMFKESLRTMYNTHKWNNDHKGQSSDISSVAASPRGKDELRNLKFSAPDIKPSKQILEAHYTETGTKDVDIQSPEKHQTSQAQDLGEILKPDFDLPPPISFEPVRFYYKPNIHLTRPSIADLNHPDFKFESDLSSADYIHDFLVPPKPNAFLSKSPFNEIIPKRRPRPKKPAPETGKVKFSGRPDRPSTGVVETAASNNIAHHRYPFDTQSHEFLHNRPLFEQEDGDFDSDYQNYYSGLRGHNFQSRYPSLTTSNPLAEDYPRPSFQKYDFNHPRTHNLMGLLRKNKRLPAGRPQNYFEKKNEDEERFEDRKSEERSSKDFEEKSDVDNVKTGQNLTRTERS